ncbi:BtrH N-terminal domain-containing protein [Agromyces sp. Marseille-P2726]|uniref:BtrH N-terminal domain-containing protein n=1 Tax=Agromyces sp. Marseille-P2726 TaxID=2709132 RepID=UPI00156F565D|nr:BtrH N-terminal domain-containing protein [Agromyces sp. Marseille-P2726]
MTTRKHLKHLVRDRMRKTGESYTVARRHIVGAETSETVWEFRGGLDGEAAALTNVLANLGVVAPHTGEPLTEAMVLGVGGGLGAGYIMWEFDSLPLRSRVLTLGFRRQWQYPDRWARGTTERLGLHAELHETGGAKSAASALDAQLDQGLPAIAWIDPYTLGHRGEPESRDGFGGPPVIVYERNGDSYAIDDRSMAPIVVSAARLAAARARVGSYKHRLITIDPERVDLELHRAVEEGLRLQVEHLSETSDSFSLPAWRKWARMTTDTRNKKGWPNVFADGLGIGSLRASIYSDAAHGAHLRGLYADFLDEAAILLGRDLGSDAWRVAADAWERIVDTALPPGDELRALIDGGPETAAARWQLQRARDEAADVPPPVGDSVMAMYEAETAALERLRAAI